MPEKECRHVAASPCGWTEGPMQRADAAIRDLVLFAGVFTCAGCGELVAAVTLHPKSGPGPVLVTESYTVLISRPGGDQR